MKAAPTEVVEAIRKTADRMRTEVASDTARLDKVQRELDAERRVHGGRVERLQKLDEWLEQQRVAAEG